ncbi:MAG: DnaD domain protein [Erysipelotrichales bacterium]|nr:DnaD domain protein [Erysipelotrichales bacterium]
MSKQAWWKKSYIDRRTYLLEIFENTTFSDSDMMLILMMDLLNEKSDNVTIEDLAKVLKRTVTEILESLNRLATEGWIIINVTSKSFTFSLDPIFELKPVKDISQTLFDKFEEQMARPLTSTEMNKLGEWMQLYDEDMIEAALREAVIYQKLSFPYINKILETWRLQNRTTEDNNDEKQERYTRHI